MNHLRRAKDFVLLRIMGFIMKLALRMPMETARHVTWRFLDIYDRLREAGYAHNDASQAFGVKPHVVAGLLIARAYGPGVEVRDADRRGTNDHQS